jgi:hypothetical protein
VSHTHAVVWIDHTQAHVLHFNLDESEASAVIPKEPHRHLHHKRGSIGPGNVAPDNAYLDEIAALLADAGEILIVGPSGAKLQLLHRVKEKHAAVAKKVVGMETVNHPSEGELLKFARKYFVAADRMKGTSPTLHS